MIDTNSSFIVLINFINDDLKRRYFCKRRYFYRSMRFALNGWCMYFPSNCYFLADCNQSC